MHVRITTVSGSVYEIDGSRQRIRRLSGVKPATPRQGQDVTWRTYDTVSPATIGRPLFIAWADENVGAPAAPGCTPGTVTSAVTRVDVLDKVN